MEQVRSFIAVELPEELKQALSRLQDELRQGKPHSVKWVDPYGIHLTLKFLGNIGIDRIGAITGAMEQAVQGIAPFQLEARDPGAFPNLKRVQVIWVGIGGAIEQIRQLHQRLESHLAPLGFAAEARAFTPHLTLARLRNEASPDERQSLGELIAATKFEVPYTIKVAAINLIKSQLTREGAIYSRISTVALNRPLSTTAA